MRSLRGEGVCEDVVLEVVLHCTLQYVISRLCGPTIRWFGVPRAVRDCSGTVQGQEQRQVSEGKDTTTQPCCGDDGGFCMPALSLGEVGTATGSPLWQPSLDTVIVVLLWLG